MTYLVGFDLRNLILVWSDPYERRVYLYSIYFLMCLPPREKGYPNALLVARNLPLVCTSFLFRPHNMPCLSIPLPVTNER